MSKLNKEDKWHIAMIIAFLVMLAVLDYMSH